MPVDGAENILVDVTAKRGTLPEGAELRARYLTEDGNEYQDAKNALDAVSYTHLTCPYKESLHSD